VFTSKVTLHLVLGFSGTIYFRIVGIKGKEKDVKRIIEI
jgi:hypothetical protein